MFPLASSHHLHISAPREISNSFWCFERGGGWIMCKQRRRLSVSKDYRKEKRKNDTPASAVTNHRMELIKGWEFTDVSRLMKEISDVKMSKNATTFAKKRIKKETGVVTRCWFVPLACISLSATTISLIIITCTTQPGSIRRRFRTRFLPERRRRTGRWEWVDRWFPRPFLVWHQPSIDRAPEQNVKKVYPHRGILKSS